MKKAEKGSYGYLAYEKKKRLLVTAVLFFIPLGIFATGYIQTKTRLNLFTVVAILGCLPACKSLVGLIMIFMQKPMDREQHEKAAAAAGSLVSGYELAVTAYEHTTLLQAVAIRGKQMVCYTRDEKTDPAYLEKHIRQMLSANGFPQAQVKVMKDFDKYCQRVRQLSSLEKNEEETAFSGDERYPGKSAEEVMLRVLCAISL